MQGGEAIENDVGGRIDAHDGYWTAHQRTRHPYHPDGSVITSHPARRCLARGSAYRLCNRNAVVNGYMHL